MRNLSQLEKADPEAHAAVVRYETSRSQAATLIQRAAPRIEKALGADGPTFQKFREALLEKNLRGTRDRWRAWAKNPPAMTRVQLLPILYDIQGQRGIPDDLVLHLAALQDKPTEFKALIAKTFSDAAANVARMMTDTEYQRIVASPGYARAEAVYKREFEAPLAHIHARNQGVFSTARGGTYYPMIPVERARSLKEKLLGKSAPYRKGRNAHNEFATGLATYDASMEAFKNNLERATKTNNHAAAVRTLEDAGLLRELGEDERVPATVEMGGEEFEAAVVKMGRGKEGITAKWLASELQPVFDPAPLPDWWPLRAIHAITTFSLQGPPVAAMHSMNIVGTLVSRTPFIGSSVLSKSIGSLQGVKIVNAVWQLLHTDVSDADATARAVRMAQEGTLPPRFRSVTYSRKFAEQTGAKLVRFTIDPWLHGQKGLDARARILMDRGYDAMVPPEQRSTLDRYKFINQLGQYHRGLQSGIVRGLARGGLAPFAVAGHGMTMNGINTALGTGPVPGNKWSYRVAMKMTNGLVGMALLYTAIHRLYTGKWPWNDRNARLMEIPLNPGDRNSPLGRAIGGKKPGTAYVSLSLINPLLVRGLRATGIKGAFDTRQAGGSGGQMLEHALMGAINAAMEPAVSGPIPRAASVFALGTEPRLTSIHPPSGFPVVKKTRPGLPYLGEHAKEAALSMNPFFQDVAAGFGVGHKAEEAEKHGAWWLKMAVDLAAPRLGAGVTNNAKKRERLRAEARGAGR